MANYFYIIVSKEYLRSLFDNAMLYQRNKLSGKACLAILFCCAECGGFIDVALAIKAFVYLIIVECMLAAFTGDFMLQPVFCRGAFEYDGLFC